MKLLVDENLSPRIAELLNSAGHEATHVDQQGLRGAIDQAVLEHALANGQTVISADSDFTSMLAIQGLASPSLVLLRSSDYLSPQGQAALLIANLPAVINDLEAGSVVSLSPGHLRVRALPIQR